MNYFEANNTQACTITIKQPWLYDNVNVNENLTAELLVMG